MSDKTAFFTKIMTICRICWDLCIWWPCRIFVRVISSRCRTCIDAQLNQKLLLCHLYNLLAISWSNHKCFTINFFVIFTMRKLSQDQIYSITTLLDEGVKPEEISKIVGCGKSTVAKYRSKMLDHRSPPMRGRPSKLTSTDKRAPARLWLMVGRK